MIDLSNNRISSIDREAFKGLTKLQELHVMGLTMSTEDLEESIGFIMKYLPSLETLVIRVKTTAFKLRKEPLTHFKDTSLKRLRWDLSGQECRLVDGAFAGLNLDSLDLSTSFCRIINERAFINLTLHELILEDNRIRNYFKPYFYDNNLRSFRRRLTHLNLRRNEISTLGAVDLEEFVSLVYLNLRENALQNIASDYSTFLMSLPSMQELDLGENSISDIRKLSFQSPTLRVLYLDGNPIIFHRIAYFNQHRGETSLKYVQEYHDAFRHAPNIAYISLSKCNVEGVFSRLFQNITSLKVLLVEEVLNFEGNLDNALWGLNKLEKLQLRKIGITSVHGENFNGLKSLREIDFAENRINLIARKSFPFHFIRDVTRLNLSSNPFECTCKLFWFLEWMKDNKEKVADGEYICASPASMRGKRLEDLDFTPQECLARSLSLELIITSVLSSSLCCVALFASLLYRFRWRFSMWSFYFHSALRKAPPRKAINHRKYKFDLFVIYNSKDTTWVKDVLSPRLEVHCQPPFTLCLYNRNWKAGHNIDDCIVESLDRSRKTMLLVTNAFASSEWCQFEMTMAQHRLIEKDNDNPVLAIMEDISPVNTTPRLRLLMKRKIYLEWTQDAVGQELFWKRLEQMLRSDGGSLVEAMPPREEVKRVLKDAESQV